MAAAGGTAKALGRLLRGGLPAGRQEEFWALKDVSFEVQPGEVVGIIGRNGAGKSTLLKILSRITEPTEGRAVLRGRVGSLLEVGTGFHPELTGRENIYLSGAILGMKRAEINRKFDDIVNFAEVEKFLDTPCKRYSSGMYVRLGFAVAAHLEPEILVIDEVLAVGDSAFQQRCLGKMSQVSRSGRTVLFVSHNMAAVERLCSRAMLLSSGRVQSAGAVHEVVSDYLADIQLGPASSGGSLASSDDGLLELSHVRVLDAGGSPVSAVQCGQEMRLGIGFRASRAVRELVMAVGINSLHDVRIAVLHSSIAGCPLDLEAGENEVICRTPDLPLVAGAYVLDVKVVSGRDALLWAPRITQLSVENGDFHGTGRLPDPAWGGALHLRQTWDVHHG
jgi:lipopolysaccharide transport system ATP-binding protein